jgi:hypothetical protein
MYFGSLLALTLIFIGGGALLWRHGYRAGIREAKPTAECGIQVSQPLWRDMEGLRDTSPSMPQLID